MVVETTHLNRYEARSPAVATKQAASTYLTKMTGHFISAVCCDGMSDYLTLDKDILLVEVCLGCVTSPGCFLAIETMALHHHLGFFGDG